MIEKTIGYSHFCNTCYSSWTSNLAEENSCKECDELDLIEDVITESILRLVDEQATNERTT